MRHALTVLATLGFLVGARAGTLERALECKLQAGKLPGLLNELRAGQRGFAKPAAQLALPSTDVYQLDAPVMAYGFRGDRIVVSAGRIALVVPNNTAAQVGRQLKLTRRNTGLSEIDATPQLPWARGIAGDGRIRILAYQSSHALLADAALVGCEYAYPAAAAWPDDGADMKWLFEPPVK